MTVGRIIGTGLDRALGIGFLADLPGGNAMAGAVQCLKDHFIPRHERNPGEPR